MNRFVIADPKKCIGCYTCEAACVDVHEKAGFVAHPRLTVTQTRAGTMPVQCRNCDDAPCEKVCPVKAITFEKREVQLNESLCIGCKMCALACPFGAITPYGTEPSGVLPVNYGPFAPNSNDARADAGASLHPLLAWSVGQRTIAVKCDTCNFLPEGPACIRVCPTNALRMVDEEAVQGSNVGKRTDSVAAVAAGDIFQHHTRD